MSQPDTDLAAKLKELKKIADTPEEIEAEEPALAPETAPVAEPSPEVAETETEEGTLTEEQSLLMSKISSLDSDAREERIEKLEKSGRPEHLAVAEMLRETHGIAKPAPAGVDQDVLQAAVAAELSRQGLNQEDLKAQREETDKIKALEASLREKGQDPSLATKLARNPEFVKTFYSDKYSALDLTDRVELALGKTKKFVTPAKGADITAPRGNEEQGQEAPITTMEGRIKAMKTKLT